MCTSDTFGYVKVRIFWMTEVQTPISTGLRLLFTSLRCKRTFPDGYCSTVQGLLDWFEVDLGFTKLLFIQTEVMTRISTGLCLLPTGLRCKRIPQTEDIRLQIFTNAKISNNVLQESPYISNTFSRESPNFHTSFHVNKRSPRHSKDL